MMMSEGRRMVSEATTFVLASAAKLSAMMMSGRRMVLPFFSALARTSLAVSTKSSSTREVPTERPLALRKVKTMPPPMTILSHLSRRALRTVILEETLDPPTMAAMGFSPSWMAPSRYSSSLAKRKPDRGLQEFGHALSGGVGSVGSTESVVHEKVKGSGELLNKPRLVLGLLLVETGVLEHDNIPLRCTINNGLDLIADAVGGELHLLTKELSHTLSAGAKGELVLGSILGSAQVGADGDSLSQTTRHTSPKTKGVNRVEAYSVKEARQEASLVE